MAKNTKTKATKAKADPKAQAAHLKAAMDAAWEAKAPKPPADSPAPPTPKAVKEPKAKPPKKLSCLDAAAQLLAAAPEPLGSHDLIDAMAEQGLWSSPGGKTPANTLYAAILREINRKGADSRFVKAERGRFAAK